MYQNPLVSIVIVTYNSAKYVLETLESAKCQIYQNIELIITDDHSTDQTLEICQKWITENKKRFVRTQLVTSEKNTGISPNCNRGFQLVQGEWVKSIAGDDILNPDCINTFLKYAESNPKASFIFSDMEIFGDDECFEKREFVRAWLNRSLRIFEKVTTSEYQHRQILISNTVSAPSMFINSKSFQDLGGFDEDIKLTEDRPLWLNATKKGYKILAIREKLVRYRVNGTSVQTGERYKIAKELFLQKYIFRNIFFKLLIKHIDQLNPKSKDMYLYNFLKITAFPQRMIWKIKKPETKIKKLLRLVYNSLFFLFTNPKTILIILKYYNSKIHRKSVIHYTDNKSITFGKQVTIGANVILTSINESSPDVIKHSSLIIGNRSYIGENVNISAIGVKISIGRDCTISKNVSIGAPNHTINTNMNIIEQDLSRKENDVIIEDEVSIGANSVIMPGIIIGKGAVVRDGSVVCESVPEYSIVEGNPARLKEKQE